MIGFCDFSYLLRKASRSKLLLISDFLNLPCCSSDSRKFIYRLIILELTFLYDDLNKFIEIEEKNEKIYNILTSK